MGGSSICFPSTSKLISLCRSWGEKWAIFQAQSWIMECSWYNLSVILWYVRILCFIAKITCDMWPCTFSVRYICADPLSHKQLKKSRKLVFNKNNYHWRKNWFQVSEDETFIMKSWVKLLWFLLAGVVEIQTQIRVQTKPEVVVHHKDL